MSRRQDVQSAEGIALRYPIYGSLQYISKSAPAGGEIGFAPGCDWYVPTATGSVNAGMRYINIGSNGYGTNAKAAWVIADQGSSSQFVFGNQTAALMTSAGTLYRNFTSGTAPASTGSDLCVDFFTLPANSFDKALRSLLVSAGGSITGSDSSTVKIQTTATLPVLGSALTSPTVIATTGAMSLASSGWGLQATVWKYGAAASNTQAYQETATVAGTTHGGVGAPGTLTYTEASPVYVAITINVTTTAADCKLWWWDVTGQN